MAEHPAGEPSSGDPGPPEPSGSLTAGGLAQRLEAQIHQAEIQAEEVAWTAYRDRVRARLGVRPVPSRGRGDCLSLVLLPIGLLLLLQQPVLGIAVLSLVAVFYLAGSLRLDAERRRLAAVDAEAERSWRSRHGGASPSPPA